MKFSHRAKRQSPTFLVENQIPSVSPLVFTRYLLWYSFGIHSVSPSILTVTFKRVSLGNSFGILTIFSRYSHDILTVFPRYFLWYSHDILTIFPRYSHGIPSVFPLVFPRYSHDIPFGLSAKNPRTPCRDSLPFFFFIFCIFPKFSYNVLMDICTYDKHHY
jgi:hypothetical protein